MPIEIMFAVDYLQHEQFLLMSGTFFLGSTLLFFAISLLLQRQKLNYIPGPFWASISGLWLIFQFRKGFTFITVSRGLDKKYGPVVRYAPGRVLFSDPAAIPVIYGTTKPFPKAFSYEPAIPIIAGKPVPSFVTLRDEAKVTALKKHINTAFTARATLDYEPHIDKSLRILMQRLEVEGGNKADINLAKWVSVFTFETISRIAFSDDDISVDDIEATLAGAKSRFNYWHTWFILPVWERLIYRNPFTKGMTVTSTLGARASARVRERYDNGGLGTHTDLLDRYLQGGSKSPETFTPATVTGLVISTIHAGSETTAVTLNITMYYLFHNPQKLAALRKELEAADLSSPPTYQSVMKLPYLEASIKETQRMNILNNNPLEREVHPEGATISGVFIPGGTMVAANVHVINRNPEIWGDDPDVYRPERWLEADEARRSKMERASLGFGGGKRFCLGHNIAWIEMKKALPDLLMRFDFELVYPERPLDTGKSFSTFMDDLHVKLTPR